MARVRTIGKSKDYQPLYAPKIADTVSTFRLYPDPPAPKDERDDDRDDVLLKAVGIDVRNRDAHNRS